MNGLAEAGPVTTAMLWNIRQLAEATGLSVYTIYTWVSQRKIPYVKVGKRVMFDPVEIRHWIEEHKVRPVRVVDRDIPGR